MIFAISIAVALLTAAALYQLRPDLVYALAMWAERRLAGLRNERVRVADHDVTLLRGGRGEPVLMLHGFGADRYHWPRMARHLSRHYEIAAPDLPGFGVSSCLTQDRYGLHEQVARLVALLDALAWDRVHLVGNSMGGHLAAALARAHPQRVRSLALLDAAGVDPQASTEFNEALAAGTNLLLADSRRDFRRLTAMMFVQPPFLPGRVLDYLGDQATARNGWNARVFDQYRESFEPLEQGPAMPDVPALVLWGQEDRVLPVEDAQVFARLLPQAEVVLLPQTGHLPMLERPREVATHCQRLFQRTQGAPGPQGSSREST
ncbi:MAG: alpha/beta fold hydrolase [Pseudomonadota bacterium]